MAYVGQQPVVGRYILLDQISGGFNGTASGFTMTAGGQGVIPGLAQNVLLSLGGVIQQPGADYLVSGSGLTFTTPPVSGTTFFATVLGDAQAVGTPSDGTVIPASIASSGTFVFPNVTVTGVTTIASGTSAAPSLSISGDANTGLYSPGADQLAIATSGTGRLFVDASGNVSVGTYAAPDAALTLSRSGNSYLFLHDATSSALDSAIGNVGGSIVFRNGANVGTVADLTERMRLDSSGRLGLGTSTATLGGNPFRMVVLGTKTYSELIPRDGLAVADNTATAQGVGGSITLHGIYDGSGNYTAFAGIEGQKENGTSGNYAGALVLKSRTNLGNLNEALRIDSSQRVGIGTATPATTVHAVGTVRISRSDDAAQYLNLYASAGEGFIDAVNSNSGISQPIVFRNGNNSATTERARIDSSGRLLVGTSSARSNFFNTTQSANIQLEGTSGTALMSLVSNHNDVGGNAALIIGKTRGTTVGSTTVVQSGDTLGRITFQGSDGTEFVQAADITGEVDGTPGANDMPGRLVFSTTADGASTPTERMRITSTGHFKASNTGVYQSATAAFHELVQSITNTESLYIRNTSASPYGITVTYAGASPNGTVNQFLYCFDGSLRAEIRSNGGIANYSANNVNLSDRNAKKDISPAAATWDCLKEWEIVNFRYKDQSADSDLNMGVIAQQIAESCPEAITVFQEATEDQPEKLGVKDQQMMWMAIKALQEAQLRIETLEAEVAALKAP